MRLARVLKHLCFCRRQLQHAFPEPALRAITQAILETESGHSGEIMIAVESSLSLGRLLRGQSSRNRAMELFSLLRVWDTEYNSGVLIYLLLADHRVEIVADRGIDSHVGGGGWENICGEMESAFRSGKFETGVISGIRAVGSLLARHFPSRDEHGNELPNRPVIL